MKITNNKNLPLPYVRAAQPFDPPAPHVCRVSSLLRPPQINMLEREHWDEIETDVMDRLWAMDGSASHYILEQAGLVEDGYFIEEKLHAQIGAWSVRGRADLITPEGTVIDYKKTSVFTVKGMLQEMRPDYVKQLNYYAELIRQMRANGAVLPEPKELLITAESRDWRPGENRQQQDYPNRVEVIPVEMWDEGKVMNLLIADILEYEQASIGNARCCTAEERWERPTKYAIMKPKAKRATKLYDDKQDAEQQLLTYPEGTTIEVRKGAQVRCDDYCQVSSFCKQYLDLMMEK
jgi:hypothetical protein